MENIELSHAEILFLSDVLGSEEIDIAHELEAIAEDAELKNLELEMKQDQVICKSIREKLEKVMNG
jgi:hypothetical protein